MTETIHMETVEVDGKTKYTISYPLTDESGQPLLDRNQKPRFTNLVADSIEELVQKQAQANLEVARALERSSRRFDALNRQPTKKTPATKLEGKPLTQEEKVQIGLDAQDPRKAADAMQRVVESVVPVKEITQEVQRQGQSMDLNARKEIARAFIAGHKDYLPIEANNALLNRYIIEQNLEFSVENLEFAAAAMADKLVAPRAPAAAKNEPSPSDNEPAENAPPNSGTAPPKRSAPVGGLSNSQVSGRPAGDGLVLTKQQALDMLFKDRAKYEAWMRDPVKNAILNKALNSR
jgi:hypothetical protein